MWQNWDPETICQNIGLVTTVVEVVVVIIVVASVVVAVVVVAVSVVVRLVWRDFALQSSVCGF